MGLLSGGYGSDELRQADAIRVYEDPGDLLDHIDEVGGRSESGCIRRTNHRKHS